MPELFPELPAGARAYAAHPGHYDYYASNCVKDLKLSRVEIPHDHDDGLRIRFAPNPFKHDVGLTVTYRAVMSFTVENHDGTELVGLGDVMLDEVLPHPDGCSHETTFIGGRITVACSDLVAEWKSA
ncbi:hypothetical protein [Nocardiopsis rhodophaea]|uniref:hypothetical protein n=1 Tax=Nocardiopsis rhodophaea TaxID=280238 RepID=UPI0031D23B77